MLYNQPSSPIAPLVTLSPSCKTDLIMQLISMAPMSSSTLSSRFLSCLHHHHQRHQRARVFADSDSKTGPSASQPFQTNLSDMLQKLTNVSNDDDAQPYSPSSKLSPLMDVTWVYHVLDVVVAAQGSVKQVLLTHTMAHASSSHQKRMQHYMQANVKMLDACRLLEETLTRAHSSIKASHQAVQCLRRLKLTNQGGIQRAQHALLFAAKVANPQFSTKRLQGCRSMLRKMGGDILAPPTATNYEDLKTGACMAALYGNEICTLFFLGHLATALACPGQGRSSSCLAMALPPHVAGQVVWGPALFALQARLHKQLSQTFKTQRSAITLFPEMGTLEASLHNLSKSLQQVPPTQQARKDVQDLVQSTSLLVDDLQCSMARLQHHLECVRASLVDIQMTLHKSC
ncbi:hypothetical protein L7F22_031283 [Adiantum nelumboides]|nr:hypothetical protein [Adiantum nelumboides]